VDPNCEVEIWGVDSDQHDDCFWNICIDFSRFCLFVFIFFLFLCFIG
jgi:hypothetical protein